MDWPINFHFKLIVYETCHFKKSFTIFFLLKFVHYLSCKVVLVSFMVILVSCHNNVNIILHTTLFIYLFNSAACFAKNKNKKKTTE